jgi:hypothetical protein
VGQDWDAVVSREAERYRDGESRLPGIDDRDQRQRQLTRMGNAAYGAALAQLMAGEGTGAAEWLGRAVERYLQSLDGAPPDSWGRYIGCLKARILAGAWGNAEEEARRTLDAGAADSESPIGRYAAALAYLVLGEDADARRLADELRIRDDFPNDVGDAVATLAAGTDRLGYIEAIEAVLASFEQRDEYLEDVPVADTVLVLQALAARRELAAELSSPLLPA